MFNFKAFGNASNGNSLLLKVKLRNNSHKGPLRGPYARPLRGRIVTCFAQRPDALHFSFCPTCLKLPYSYVLCYAWFSQFPYLCIITPLLLRPTDKLRPPKSLPTFSLPTIPTHLINWPVNRDNYWYYLWPLGIWKDAETYYPFTRRYFLLPNPTLPMATRSILFYERLNISCKICIDILYLQGKHVTAP